MSEDTDPVIIGEPLTPEDMADMLTISQQDIDDAIIWWDEIADDLFVGALEWNA